MMEKEDYVAHGVVHDDLSSGNNDGSNALQHKGKSFQVFNMVRYCIVFHI
jgi:hypothetical protein